MIGYVTVGTNDLKRAAAFFDDLLAGLGAKRAMENERFIAWATGAGSPMLLAIQPADGKPATAGNGAMVALAADSHAKVDEIHAKAMSLGAKDEGAPGIRQGTFYGGYFRDLDGNKYVCFTM